jgi:hypothetical protein
VGWFAVLLRVEMGFAWRDEIRQRVIHCLKRLRLHVGTSYSIAFDCIESVGVGHAVFTNGCFPCPRPQAVVGGPLKLVTSFASTTTYRGLQKAASCTWKPRPSWPHSLPHNLVSATAHRSKISRQASRLRRALSQHPVNRASVSLLLKCLENER